MPTKFVSLAAFADFITHRGLRDATDEVLREVARQAGDFMIEEIHRVIGTYEYNWKPLKPQTVARKTTGDSPLLESGKLKASYTYRIFKVRDGYRVRVTSTMPDIAFAHEFGTAHVPPRPVITPTVEKAAAMIHARLGPWAIESMANKRVTVHLGRG